MIRRTARSGESSASEWQEKSLTREWLVTNGLGGYASGTVSGLATRRYHGLLIAAWPPPLGRRLTLSHLSERLRMTDGTVVRLSGEPHGDGAPGIYGIHALVEFRLEMGLPVWRYEMEGAVIEKQVVMPHGQNTVYVIYRLLDGKPLRLKLMPSVHHRSHDAPVSTPLPGTFHLTETDARYEMSVADLPTIHLCLEGSSQAFTVQRQTLPEVVYPVEEGRGYERSGTLWSPGYFRVDLLEREPVALVASTESWEVITAIGAEAALKLELERRERRVAAADHRAREGLGGELVLAADQFVIQPVGRTRDEARIRAAGDEMRSVIAGYHWFTDWGRDTMISLEGLTLVTGRHADAACILRTFAHYVRDGLLPNLFPEGEDQGLYHTADATLWFFHAVDRYVRATGDRTTLETLLPKLAAILEHHLRGTSFGIGVDPADGLLRQGASGYQLTWMDAKVGDWVVTPRRGKAVEINALWYNALCLMADWCGEKNDADRPVSDAAPWRDQARQTRESFNRRFWYEGGGYLFDVVDGEDGDDATCRPNQVLAFSLEHPVLDAGRRRAVLDVVRSRLLTPVGLRSLEPEDADYQARYYGDIYSRDAAYHQGTVWAWLIGPFVDAWLRVHPGDLARARQFLCGFDGHLNDACVGSISEIFDAEDPFTPRGCISQAWSVAEALRCWVKTAPV